jgi:hypothetical protein
MFNKPRRSKLSRALEQATDPVLRSLRAEVARRQERTAELELELFDLRVSLAEFERELEVRVRPLERELLDLRTKLDQLRREAARKAQWGERANQEEIPDVVEQFRKAWTPKFQQDTPSAKPAPTEPQQGELRSLYRELAKRFHPDLTTDPKQKPWREEMMAKVNLAYEANDLAALRGLQQQAERPAQEAEVSRDQMLIDLHSEIRRLDRVIAGLQSEADRLERSEVALLKLDAVKARLNGYDLLAAMARDFGSQIAQIRAELASLA